MYPVNPWEKAANDDYLILRAPKSEKFGLSLSDAERLAGIYSTANHEFVVVDDIFGRDGFSAVCPK